MNTENYSISEEYRELAEIVIEEHEDLWWLRTADVRIDYLSSTKEKKSKGKFILGECQLVKEIYKVYVPYDFFIIFYEPNLEGLTYDQLKIVMYHELLHVNVKDTDGEPQYDVNPHDIEDFRKVIDKYGLDWNQNG